MSYTKIFTNNSIIVKGLCHLLEDASIKYLIKDDVESARLAGFGAPSNSVEVHVFDADIDMAKEILKAYTLEINT